MPPPAHRLHALWNHPAGAFALLLLAGLLYWGGEHTRRALWEPDEARFAYVSREMARDGRWLVPHRHGEFYAHKPPMMFWLINAASAATGTGVNSVTARLPSLFGATCALWSVVMLLRGWGRHDLALPAALACASTFLFWKQGGWGQIDMLLLGWVMLALLGLFAQDRNRSRAKACGAYAAMGLAILTKGPVGFLVPLGAYLTAKLAAGERGDLRRGHWIWGPLVTLAFPGLWLALVGLNDPPPGYLRELLWDQSVERAQGGLGHGQPWHYFLPYLALDGLPWILVAPFAWRALGESEQDRRLRRRLAGWMLFILVFFSAIASKRNLYILAIYPALAILVAAGWRALVAAPGAGPRRVLALLHLLPPLLGVAALAAGLAAPWIPAPVELHLGGMVAGGALVAAAGVWFRPRPATGVGLGGLHRLAALWLATFAAAGALFLPCFNAHKTPGELKDLASGHLARGEPLLLYQINGEIQALVADAPGRRVKDGADLAARMDAQPHGFIVAEMRRRPKPGAWGPHPDPNPLPAALRPRLRMGEFRMGSKTMVWAEWGDRP